MKKVYEYHIKAYLKKLIKLRTNSVEDNDAMILEHQGLLKELMEQKQLSVTLSEKVPKKLLG